MSQICGVGLALAIAWVSWWVCAAMACAKCAGHLEDNLFKKAKGRLYYLSLVHVHFYKVQVVTQLFPCPRGKSLLGSRQPFCLKHNLSRPYGWQRLCLRSGGTLKRFTVPTCRTKLRKLNVKLRLHPSMK